MFGSVIAIAAIVAYSSFAVEKKVCSATEGRVLLVRTWKDTKIAWFYIMLPARQAFAELQLGYN